MSKHFVLYGVVVLCTITLPVFSMAQTMGKFGEIEQWERDLKVCDFDTEADAAVLLSEGRSDYDDHYQLITTYHVRIKILRESGIDRASISIHYQSDNNYQYVSDVTAKTFNTNENGLVEEFEVEKKSVYRKQLNKYFSTVTFAFPRVKVGSIIEYSYRKISKSYWALHDWTFQDRIPVYRSSYKLNVVPNLVFTWSVQKSPDYQIKIDQHKQDGDIFFEMKNIAGLDDEPYMDSRNDYEQRVDFQISSFQGMAGTSKYMATWAEVCHTLNTDESFGRQTRVNVKEADDYIKLSVNGKDPMTRMRLVHDLIRNNVQWDHVNSLYAVDGVKTTWSKKSGSSASVNLLLVNALKSAGLEAYPMLVSERGNGKINESTPFIDQFNAVYAAVVIDGRNYYLDARDQYTPAHLIPTDILNTTAFIVNARSGQLIHIADDKTKYSSTIFVEETLGEDASLIGWVNTVYSEYARDYAMHEYGGRQEEYVKNNFRNKVTDISIDSFEFENLDDDTMMLKQKFAFSAGAEESGEYRLLSLNTFSEYRTNPFLKENRFSNINFGYAKSVKIITLIHLPENVSVDAVPKNISMTNQSKTIRFTRQLSINKEKTITSIITVNLGQSWFERDQYPELREFYKKMVDFLNEQVVLKTVSR
jgi:Domain of Unknown Function with PDB structure (DUF3857)